MNCECMFSGVGLDTLLIPIDSKDIANSKIYGLSEVGWHSVSEENWCGGHTHYG